MRVLCVLLSPEAPLKELAEASLRLTPQVAVSDEALFLEVGALHRIYSEEIIVKRMQVLLRTFNLSGVLSLSDNAPTALAKARYRVRHKNKLPIECLNEFLSPFARTSELEDMIKALRRLGIYSLKGFENLKNFELSSRFGKAGLLARLRIEQSLQLVWPQFKLKERLVEKIEVDSHLPLKNLEPVLFVLKGQLDRLSARLIGRAEKASLLKVSIEQEKLSTVKEPLRSWEIELSLPLRKTSALLPILQERLEKELQAEPLVAPVTSIEIEVLEAVPSQGAQKDFFSKKEEQKEALAALVARLCEKLGPETAFLAEPRATHRPENTWVKTLEEPTSFTLPFSERPLRVLRKPESLKTMGDHLVSTEQRWQIENYEGPESLSGDWWKDPFERDYFKVTTRCGEQLWVFKEDNQLFLHGFFD